MVPYELRGDEMMEKEVGGDSNKKIVKLYEIIVLSDCNP